MCATTTDDSGNNKSRFPPSPPREDTDLDFPTAAATYQLSRASRYQFRLLLDLVPMPSVTSPSPPVVPFVARSPGEGFFFPFSYFFRRTTTSNRRRTFIPLYFCVKAFRDRAHPPLSNRERTVTTARGLEGGRAVRPRRR